MSLEKRAHRSPQMLGWGQPPARSRVTPQRGSPRAPGAVSAFALQYWADAEPL